MPAGYITPGGAGGLLRSARRWRDIFRPLGTAASAEARPTRRRFDSVGEGGGRRRGARASARQDFVVCDRRLIALIIIP